jgi:hypothetical protein
MDKEHFSQKYIQLKKPRVEGAFELAVQSSHLPARSPDRLSCE